MHAQSIVVYIVSFELINMRLRVYVCFDITEHDNESKVNGMIFRFFFNYEDGFTSANGCHYILEYHVLIHYYTTRVNREIVNDLA